MRTQKSRLITVILVLAALAALLAGCSGKKDQTDKKEESKTITVTDAKGKVKIPADPKRIVDISGNSDILSILGYSVVGTANSDAYDYTKFPSYLEKKLSGAEILGYSMQDKMDVEKILALKPDLIIISSVQEKMYQQLSKAAPTVMLKLAQTDWKEDVLKVADIMQKKEKAEAWLADYKKKAREKGKEIKKSYGKNKSYLSILASGGQIFVYDKAGIGSILYEDMGLKRPKGLPEQKDISLPVVSYEGLASIEADYILAMGTKDDMAALKKNSVWKELPAVKQGHVAELPASPYFNQGYSSIGRLSFLDEVNGLMEKMNE